MSSYSYLVPPVALATIGSPGELEQQVSQAVPGTNVGFVWYSATAPDVITYPELKRFVWVDTSGARIVKRHWNNGTLSWETETPDNNSITNAMLQGDITIDKLSEVGAVEGYILRYVSGVISWDDPSNMFTPGGFLYDDAAMKLPGTAGTWVQHSNGTTTGWTSFATLFAAQTVAIAKIATTGALTQQALSYVGTTLGYNYVETLLRDGQTPITKLTPSTAKYVPRTNAAGTALEWVAASTIVDEGRAGAVKKFTSGLINIPAAGAAITPVTHGLAARPDHYQWFLVCNDAAGEAGFAQNDEVALLSTFSFDSGADDRGPYFSQWVDATNLYLRRDSSAGGIINIFDKTTGTATNITDSKWRLKCVAVYFP